MSRATDPAPRTGGRAWVRVQRWWLDLSLLRKGWIVMALPLVALWPTLGASAYLVSQQQDLRVETRTATTSVEQAGDVLQLVIDAETGVRGYAATDDPTFLEPYDDAVEALPAAMAALEAGVEDRHLRRVDDLQAGVQAELRLLEELQQAVTAGASPVELVGIAIEGRDSTDAIRSSVATLEDTLTADVVERRSEVDDLADTTFRLLVASLVLGGFAGLAGMALFANGVTRRLDAVNANVERFLEGEPLAHVELGEDEIGVLGQELIVVADTLTERDEQLRQSRDEALVATRAKDEFLSRMSHELRTPLTAVIGFGQLLQLEDLRPDDRESADHIVRAGQHLLALINEVLDIAKIETGHLTLSVEPVELDELLAETTSLMGPVADAAGITMVPADVTGIGVLADRQRLKQVLLNLLSNAIKYNRPRGMVTVLARSRGSSIVRLSVADTGRGIAAGDRDRVFAPFDRIEAEHSDVEGTGVGLALSKGLVEAMGGTIDLETTLDQGSTFWVELPRAEVHDRLPDPAWYDRLHPTDTSAAPVLLVEDNEANVRVIERVFKRRGEPLEVTSQGSQAIELAVRLQPRLILLDMDLPDLDGAEVLQRLKADPETVDVPVVVVSASISPGRQKLLLHLGAHDVLPKPLDLPRLLELLDETVVGPDGEVHGDLAKG